MISIALTDTSIMTALSVPSAKLCPGLELVIPATPEQSLHTKHPGNVLPETMNALATSCARICHVEKALPLSGMSQKIITPSLGSHQMHKQKTCRKQGECCQYWTTHLHSQIMLIYTLWSVIDLAKGADVRKLEPSGIDAHKQGKYCQSQVLHQPRLRVLLALNLLVRLREPSLLSLRHWHSRHKARLGVKQSYHHKRVSRSSRCYHTRAGANPRCCHHRVSVDSMQCCKGT